MMVNRINVVTKLSDDAICTMEKIKVNRDSSQKSWKQQDHIWIGRVRNRNGDTPPTLPTEDRKATRNYRRRQKSSKRQLYYSDYQKPVPLHREALVRNWRCKEAAERQKETSETEMSIRDQAITPEDTEERKQSSEERKIAKRTQGKSLLGNRNTSPWMALSFAVLVIVSLIKKCNAYPTQPMLCNTAFNDQSRPHLLLNLPDQITCAKEQDHTQDVTNLDLQLYKTSSIILQNRAHLCTKRTSHIKTMLFFFSEERIHRQKTTYEPVMPEECDEMIKKRTIGNKKLKEVNGIISTHNPTNPVYKW